MRNLYSSPLRVYLLIAVLACVGIFSGLNLPISLFPNSNQPLINTYLNYGGLTAEEFAREHGSTIESTIQAINENGMEVTKLISDYHSTGVDFQATFNWGTDAQEATRKVREAVLSLSGRWSQETRDSMWVGEWGNSNGFIAISFFSDTRSQQEVYDTLEPLLNPAFKKVQDSNEPQLWNPDKKEISITLKHDAMVSLGLFPKDVASAIRQGFRSAQAGAIRIGKDRVNIQMPRKLQDLESLKKTLISLPNGTLIPLSQISDIDLKIAVESNRVYKTNGTKSVMLFATPKPGGNIKRMAEEIVAAVEEAYKTLPKDFKYQSLIDPSQFIRSSVENVLHEVFLAAGLAVLVLFLFIGSFKNTITAAIEIPLSMILAFIMMKATGMNLNLISLGGMALAAGMNVDASVVVLENILRHFRSSEGPLTFDKKLSILTKAVKEVALPVVASTLSTLVVFAPLAFTSDITYAILGDLAKAVVFSHGFSMLISLVLVPTIRLQMLSKSGMKSIETKSPIEGGIQKLEQGYQKLLSKLIHSKKLQISFISGVLIALSLSLTLILPNLKREIIGTPDSDMLYMSINNRGNRHVKEMEDFIMQQEEKLKDLFGERIHFTFSRIWRATNGSITIKLKNKKEMDAALEQMKEAFPNQPGVYFWMGSWSPTELNIPDPPDLRISMRGGTREDRNIVARTIENHIRNENIFDRAWSDPRSYHQESIIFKPYEELWPHLYKQGVRFTSFDILDTIRTMNSGKDLDYLSVGKRSYKITLGYDVDSLGFERIGSLPIKVGEKMIPMRALGTLTMETDKPPLYRYNGRNASFINANMNSSDEVDLQAKEQEVQNYIQNLKLDDLKKYGVETMPSIEIEDAKKELNTAIKQLGIAMALSIGLILLTLLLQFSSLGHSMIIMVAIPLGILGGLVSLFVCGSTLSLNSVLGMILLNGIAVNNSIILVDFMRRGFKTGLSPVEAALWACKKRLRPILITSLTTILGMMPVAMGLGDGGKILKPLGIAVAGGLWFSMLFTLFVVPLLEVYYMKYLQRKSLASVDTDDLTLQKENKNASKSVRPLLPSQKPEDSTWQ